MTKDNTTAHAREILRALRITLVEVLEAAPTVPDRVRLGLDGAELDVSWSDHARSGVSTISGDRPPAPGTPLPEVSVVSTHAVRAPLVGTFYRAPEPGSAPFVEVGDIVTRGQHVGIIEAMKLMNMIEADRDGRIVELLVADGSPVEFDQPLVLIDPT